MSLTKADIEAYHARMEKAASIPNTLIDDLYAVGRLNGLILGALKITLQNLDYNPNDVSEALRECRRGTFDLYMASQLKEAGEE